jgi:hypothetical protein
MATIDGAWAIEIATPMGTQRFALDLRQTGDAVTGTATNKAGAYSIDDGTRDGDSLTFSVGVQSPFPLTIAFDLRVEGDVISGQAKTGPFPPSPVTGSRG